MSLEFKTKRDMKLLNTVGLVSISCRFREGADPSPALAERCRRMHPALDPNPYSPLGDASGLLHGSVLRFPPP